MKSSVSAERYRGYVNHTLDGVWELDTLGYTVFANPRMAQMLGYDVDEIKSRNAFEFVHPDDLPRALQHWERRLHGAADTAEWRLRRKDGSFLWAQASATPLYDAAGKMTGAFAIFHDISARKIAEQALQQSEARHRQQSQLLELAQDAIIVRDLDGRIQFWNAAAASTYGWSKHEAVGKLCHELLSTDYPAPPADIDAELLCSGRWQGELCQRRRDHQHITVDTRWALQREHDGQPVAVIETSRDITERKTMEAALRERDERLQAALLASRTGTYQWNCRTNEVKWDSALHCLFGLPTGPIVCSLDDFVELLHPEDRERVTSHGAWCVAQHVEFATEYRVIWPDGSVHWLYSRGKTTYDNDGEPLYMVGACTDLTSQRRTQEQLARVESRERAILENLPVGVWFLDGRGSVVFGNRAAQAIWGVNDCAALEQLSGCRGWWHDTGKPLAPDDWAGPRAIRDRKAHLDQLLDILCIDGSRKTILNSAVPVENPDGSLEGAVVFNLDVTEQSKAQAALRESNDQLETRIAERTARLQETISELEAFSYSVSHDMRAPLRAMQSFSIALLDDYAEKLDATGKDMLRRVARGAQRLDLLIRDVLSYSRVTRAELALSVVDTDRLVEELIAQYPTFRPPHADVILEHPLGSVFAHEAVLSQVFTNLIDNGVKFVAPNVAPQIRVRSEPVDDDHIRFWVEDNGIGIAPQHRDRVFAIFGRVHPETQYRGTGIGLAIVKKAVERLGGELGLESTVGVGSRFWFTLRRADSPRSSAVPTSSRSLEAAAR